MRTTGVSVPDVVREIITRNRSIYECMKMDIINYTALAVKIQPDVEKQLGTPANLNTIVVAIKRYADSFDEKEDISDEPILKNARLSLTDRIMGLEWNMVDFVEQDVSRMFAEAQKAFSDSEFFRFGDSFRILTEDSDSARHLFQSFPKENDYRPGLAKIKIQISGQNRSDVLSYVTQILHYNGIEIVDALLSQDGVVLIFKEEDAPRAYEKLRTEIR
jgi:hypothetical protein